MRNLVVVFGDQLDHDASAFDGFDAKKDRVWMAESFKEASHVWSNKNRIAFFFASMRHFSEDLKASGRNLIYHELGKDDESLAGLLAKDLESLSPEAVVCTLPGEWRILEELRQTCDRADVPLDVRKDRHFLDSPENFREWAEGKKSIRLEYYYRELRKRHGILVTDDLKPIGGEWNFDKENRGAFGKAGPDPERPGPTSFPPDKTTQGVLELVEKRFPRHPGKLDSFAWPVTARDARKVLQDFISDRLPLFGKFQDAMWTGEPFLYHSLISSSLNVKLLNPREVVGAAVKAYETGAAPLNAVEGFVRQVLGWREYVRGVYWWKMPEYLELNGLAAGESLPEFYWTAETPYTCLRESIGQTLEFGYAHHIQRLMVTGLYGLLLGVQPKAMHEWYLAAYVDAVEWVELPNTLGMSQYGDGGIMASKPYIASGKYIQRMSNYCDSCPANPSESTGQCACPFTTLYWDFLIQKRESLGDNRRLSLQFRNADRLNSGKKAAISKRAKEVRADPSGKGLFS
ncbi:cryptochrome/photolyase family protein [Puniceicoccales bacterium CK1056]|uniref:Cryptochrome/photolyase family protein n=1 Tax=Oceanipulchritudo coccoides TaxID=2706888 RepID=A0A6B2LY65_9BACT|nr:cryptochrome/photolyase family protein [Oceanipulchritudo coccoides]